MTSSILRSVLYMPGSNQRAMDKARDLPADAVVFDLEDAVAPEAKVAARDSVKAQLAQGGYGSRRLVVRINGMDTPWGADDLIAFAGAGLTTLCLPKVESAELIDTVSTWLSQEGADGIALWPMIETPTGVMNAQTIAQHPAVEAMVMGTTDLASALRVPHRPDRLGLQYALSHVVMAARCYDKVVLDGVSLVLDDDAAFTAICKQGQALGFDGKTLIHPRQIAPANAVFSPSADEVAHARRLLTTWSEAAAKGEGVAVLDGRLIEAMHVNDAERVLAIAEHLSL